MNLNFMGHRYTAAALSGLMVLISVISLAINGLKLGLDFTGGTLIEVGYSQPVVVEEVRNVLEEGGFRDVAVQHFGNETDIIIRMSDSYDAELGDRVLTILSEKTDQSVAMKRSEFVGAQIGEELRDQGGLAMLMALAVVMIYVAFRFQMKFAVGAVVALAHDVIIVLGIFSLFQLNFDLTVLAAILAVIGYSLNDTIVVFDRVRENFRLIRETPAVEIVNESINHTFGRTMITSFTTLLVLVALLVVGGEMIHNFALALLLGVVVGTYSSIYVASALLLYMKMSREDLLPSELQKAEDELP